MNRRRFLAGVVAARAAPARGEEVHIDAKFPGANIMEECQR